MSKYTFAHLSDDALLADTRSPLERDRATTALLIAHLAEVEARGLYALAGYRSMFDWCVGQLGLAEDSAHRRIQAARVARLHPVVLPMVADGRLTLDALVLLAPVLTADNAGELLAAAAGLSTRGLERLIVERFPKR